VTSKAEQISEVGTVATAVGEVDESVPKTSPTMRAGVPAATRSGTVRTASTTRAVGPVPAVVTGERRKEADPLPQGPRVRMSLPDGQHLEVTLVSWHRYRDGTWRARVRWPVWGAYGFGEDVQTKAWAMESFVPSHVLGPLDGQDYETVRRDRPQGRVPRQP
jgi:hypothetical protein